jgi:uncharacterized protein (DUF433 family)
VTRDMRFSVPLFTIEEASRYVGRARSTLRDWTLREAGPAPLVHRLDPESPRAASLPFIAVVEAHMLSGFSELGLKPAEIRKSVTRMRRELGDEYALATRRVATDGVSLLIDMAGSFENPSWERVRDGQQVINEVIQRYIKFVRWDTGHIHATRLKLKTYRGADVIIDPRFAFGQPVLEREKVRVEDILDAFWAGESYNKIADEYGVKPGEVEAVIRSATRRQRAA